MDSQAEPHSLDAIEVADEVWIATALLHQEQPRRQAFTVEEITRRAEKESISGAPRKVVATYAYLHCVANQSPSPEAYRVLYATGPNTRRLYRAGDPAHSERSAKVCPTREQIPERYGYLLDWYDGQYTLEDARKKAMDPLIALRGFGSDIWKGIDADQYVRELRHS